VYSTPMYQTTRFAIALIIVISLLPLSRDAGSSSTVDYGGYRPHYQGFGVTTPGGRRGAVLRVTNLNDSGSGSLRAALEATGPRYVIFETSGTISLSAPIFVTSPYVTIAGQTAPSPGINIRNYGIYFDTHDVVVQHIRMRYGDTHQTVPGQFATMSANMGAYNVVLDHVSFAWTMYIHFGSFHRTGEGPNPTNVAVLDSLFAYALTKDHRYTGYGAMQWGREGGQFTQARNLYVHNSYRQPGTGIGRTQIVNNVVYGSGPFDQAEDFGFGIIWAWSPYFGNSYPAHRFEQVWVNTVTIPSIGTGNGATAGSDNRNRTWYAEVSPQNVYERGDRIWLAGNEGPYITGPTGAGQYAGIHFRTAWEPLFAPPMKDFMFTAEPSWHAQQNFATIATEDTPAYVFANAGARPLDRDSVDTAAVNHARAGRKGDNLNMGRRITSQEEMGGHPVLIRNTRPLTVPANPNAVAPGQTFRTNIEVWLEDFARQLEPGSPISGGAPDPPSNVRLVH
jgi:hypothetical protein